MTIGPRVVIPWARWYRPTMVAITIVLGFFALSEYRDFVRSSWGQTYGLGNGDLVGYLEGARRFLETGTPYAADQLSGQHWHLEPHSFIHPPSALFLMVPFLWLPAVLWWILPIVGTAALIRGWRPAPWTWPLMMLSVAWPRSAGTIVAGNSDLWAAMFVALGCRYGWGFALLAIKPTFAPLALLRARSRTLWLALAIVAAISLPMLGLWLQYATVIRNTDIDLLYSVLNLPLILLPVVAWAGRR